MAADGFDVVVVGAGAAGCVVAARLSEDPSRRVILLEAGPAAPEGTPDLDDAWRLPRPPDWGFVDEPKEGQDPVPLRRTRMVGGTSWLTRFALRGGQGDSVAWTDLGLVGWALDDVLPAYRRLESDRDFGDRHWHGADGPIPVSRYRDVALSEPHAALVAAAQSVGFPWVEDHNEPGAVGVGPMPMSSTDGCRVTTYTAYLEPVLERTNLVVRPDAQVAQVVINGNRATGVRLVDGSFIRADVVVLCAGTYGSPSILLRSGVGPAPSLADLGITVSSHLPGVGSNLADHPAADLELQYAGPARPTPLMHSIATFRSAASSEQLGPDLMLWFSDPDLPDSPPQLTVEVVLLRPQSRGEVQLRSTDPNVPPIIRLPDATSDKSDLARLVEGYQRALELVQDPDALNVCGGPARTPPRDKDEIVRRVVDSHYSLPHVSGTCAMGPTNAPWSVVDERGRVHGIEGLVVADASVLPLPSSGFTHLPTVMVAERICDFLAADR